MNEERINLAEASCSSDLNIFPQQDIPGVSAKESSKSGKRKSTSVSNLSQNVKNESGKSAKQLRKRTAAPQLVDDPQDEALDGDGFPCKPPSNSIVDEGEIEYDYRA